MKSNGPKTNEELWSLLKHLIDNRALSLTIKNGDSTIIMKLKGNTLETELYMNGSLRKVAMHTANSGRELIHALEELGIGIWQLIRKLAVLKLWRKKPLYLELLPNPDTQQVKDA